METTHEINWVENKGNYLKCTDTNGVSFTINQVDKKGEKFPDYENIKAGVKVTGNIWTSEKGNTYLFAPKPKTGGYSGGARANNSASIVKAQAVKAENIEHAQERKETSMAKMASARDATLLLIQYHPELYTLPEQTRNEVIRNEWRKMRAWLSAELGDDSVPFA